MISFQEALQRSSCRLRRPLSLPGAPPLQAISQSYKNSGIIANHEGVSHPVGALFVLNKEYEILLPAGAVGANSEERTLNNGNHTVTTSYGGGACERRFSISSSHVVCADNCIKIHYASDSRGDAFCSLNACHHFDDESLLSTSYIEGKSSDPIVDVELQQGRRNLKAMGKLEKNLASGRLQLHVHSKAVLPAKLTVKNSVSTNFQGDSYFGLEFARASRYSTCNSRFLLGPDGSREFFLQGSLRFGKGTLTELSTSTNFDVRKSFSFKLEHGFGEENKVSMNVTSFGSSIQDVSAMALFSRGRSSLKWKFRKASEGEYMLGMEWQQGKGESDGTHSINIETTRQGITLNGELSHIF